METVGGRVQQELWVPAEHLEEFNRNIVDAITVEAAYYGDGFTEEIDPETNLPACLGGPGSA